MGPRKVYLWHGPNMVIKMKWHNKELTIQKLLELLDEPMIEKKIREIATDKPKSL